MGKITVLQRCFGLAVAGFGLTLAVLSGSAQEFTLAGIPGQVHIFASQGFALSDQNNYLTMDTSQGSFDFRDAGVNLSLQITDKFRVGAQAYDRQIGNLGRGTVTLDWAVADYRFSDWIGVRAGKIKTTFGLYNDTQDVESLHTWAILPQSFYPLDLRGLLIAHLGGDIYGGIPVGKLGLLSYTAYAGTVSENRTEGLSYGLEAVGIDVSQINGDVVGADLRWNTPIRGAVVGASLDHQQSRVPGANQIFGDYPYEAKSRIPITGFYGQYSRGKLRLDAEYGRSLIHYTISNIYGPFPPAKYLFPQDNRDWYTAAAYRISKFMEVGAYHSRFYPNNDKQYPFTNYGYLAPPARHIYDQAATIRFDFKNHWDFKVEGHFIDGYGDLISFRSFYPQDNPQGLKPKTNLLVLRLGFNL